MPQPGYGCSDCKMVVPTQTPHDALELRSEHRVDVGRQPVLVQHWRCAHCWLRFQCFGGAWTLEA